MYLPIVTIIVSKTSLEEVDLADLSSIPQWLEECLASPKNGINVFLKELCLQSGAKYAHIRIPSRLRNYYILVDSIGPYKNLGWRRRFHLLDGADREQLAYQFIDYRKSQDCRNLEQKYIQDSAASSFLREIIYGLWIPLEWSGLDFGYVVLSWDHADPNPQAPTAVSDYIKRVNHSIPLLFSACRSQVANGYLNDLWEAADVILSAPTQSTCYDRIAAACTILWGPDTTTYVGTPDDVNQIFDVVAVHGYQANKGRIDKSKQFVPYGKGLFSRAVATDKPQVIRSFSSDHVDYFSILVDNDTPGSAIVTALRDPASQAPVCVISMEHEQNGYFDDDDLRYLIGLSRVGYAALMAHAKAEERLSQEIDTLFTQMAHDVHEPLQALINDADILRYEANALSGENTNPKKENILSPIRDDIAHRSSNILETCLDLNKVVRNHLDAGLDGASTRAVSGKVNLFRTLNSLVDTWGERAITRGIQLNPLYNSLRGTHVKCDEAELRSALGHLIGNAIKYSYSGRKLSQGALKYGRYVNIIGRIIQGKAVVEIQNLGIGILKHELSAVKDKYVRGQLAIKEGRAGTGRGLWSANKFFDSIGGSIEIYSEFKGTDSIGSDGPYFTSVKAIIPCKIPLEA